MIEGSVAFATFFTFYSLHGKEPGELLLKFTNGDEDLMYHGQCFYFYALVVMQFGNVLTSRTARIPIWRQNPFVGAGRNPRIFVAILVSALIVMLTCYLPFVQATLKTEELPSYWQCILFPWLGALLLICL